MKWLITGGCGFIGCNLAGALLDDGEEVILLDNLYRHGSARNLDWIRSIYRDGAHFVNADVRDSDRVSRIVRDSQPDVLCHLAGQVAMTTSLSDPRLDFEVNAAGTLNVLEAVRNQSPGTMVLFSSTNKVYGSLENVQTDELESRYILPAYPGGLDETIPLDGHSPYGCSKLAADQYVRDYYRVYGIRTVVFRHSSVYGGRQFATYDQGWIGWFCGKALEGPHTGCEPFSINGNGKQVRDILYVDDVVSAYRGAALSIDRTAGRVYNIGGGADNSLSLLELFGLLEAITGNQLHYFSLDWRVGDQKVFIADTRSARMEFGWFPRMDKDRGIRLALDWCREVLSHD
jgi:CDP-paratose 2-epimerase